MDLSKRIKRHITAIPHDFRAVCHPGFESTCAAEFTLLDVNIPLQTSFGAVDFTAKLEDAWKLIAFSRTCTRIVMRIGSFTAENFGRLEKKALEIPWELYYPQSPLPQIKVTCKKSRLYHSDAIAERLQKIVYSALEERGLSPSENATLQPQTLFVHFENDRCTLSVDLAGEPLYKRGFDRHVEEAPVRDTFAASMLLEGGILRSKKLFDPMSGSGTFSSEAALVKAHANLWKTRSYALQNAPSFRPAAWNFMVNHTSGLEFLPEFQIFTSDLSSKALSTVEYNLKSSAATLYLQDLASDALQIYQADFFDLPKPSENSLLALNPPYGKRITADIPKLYREIGKKIRSDFSNSNIALIVPGKEAENALNMVPKRRIESINGGIDVSVFFW